MFKLRLPIFVWIQNFCSSQTPSSLSHHKVKAGKGLKVTALLKAGPPALKRSDLAKPPPTARERSRERARLDLLSFGCVIFGEWSLKTKSIRTHEPPQVMADSQARPTAAWASYSLSWYYIPIIKKLSVSSRSLYYVWVAGLPISLSKC